MVPTRDHDVIFQWAQDYDATPAQLTQRKFDGEPAKITFIFGEDNPGTPEVQPIPWETFFALFDLLALSLSFDEGSPRFELLRVNSGQQQNVAESH